MERDERLERLTETWWRLLVSRFQRLGLFGMLSRASPWAGMLSRRWRLVRWLDLDFAAGRGSVAVDAGN